MSNWKKIVISFFFPKVLFILPRHSSQYATARVKLAKHRVEPQDHLTFCLVKRKKVTLYLKVKQFPCYSPKQIVQVDPKTALDRAQKRATPEDKPLDLEYFEHLHFNYEDMIKKSRTGVEVLTLDAKDTQEHLAKDTVAWIFDKLT